MSSVLPDRIYKNISDLDIVGDLPLPAHGSWPESIHQFDRDSLNALKAALAARRPLLLRGDPGTGKSQLARAAAFALKRLFVYDVITSHTESQDLLWRFDAVARLAAVQALTQQSTVEEREKALDSKRYLSPGPIWWALDWQTANKVYENSHYKLNAPEKPQGWEQSRGSVLLIDEIDKANSELPNGLLEILGNNAVSVPWLDTAIGGKDNIPPLVIITTNEERELPAAFVRRCLVLNLELPRDEAEFMKIMVERGRLHHGDKCSPAICKQAAEQLVRDRNIAITKGMANLPGQAEYLDMLRALSVLGKTEDDQKDLLQQIAKFTFEKYPKAYAR